MNNIDIKSSSGIYTVSFPSDLTALSSALLAIPRSIFVVDNEIVRLYPELIHALHERPMLSLDATEEEKTFEGAEKVLDFFQTHHVNKASTVIAIGGGIIQDISCFAAHIYYRGIPFVFVPTTLLSMCDSCIGSKNGLNYKGYKNQIGAFQAPAAVLICKDFLGTLPEEAIRSGYGEILKLALIDGAKPYSQLRSALDSEGIKTSQVMDFIYSSLWIKKNYIEADEFDTGQRRILNYGHTFGHALEGLSNYAIPHGIAVAMGMDIVNYISWKKGYLKEADYWDIHQCIKKHFHLNYQLTLDIDILLEKVKKDKKVMKNQLNLILLKEVGHSEIEPVEVDTDMCSILTEYFESCSTINLKTREILQ